MENKDNYIDTMKRMYNSSNILFKEKDFHNACYLAGYVLETFLKHLIQKNIISHNIEKLNKISHNIEKLNNYIISNSSISHKIQNINFENIKKNWEVSKRYIEKSNEWHEETAKKFNEEIKNIMKYNTNENINSN